MPDETASSEPWWDDGGVLMHIGPHKTGTTALQHSLAAARPKLAAQSILYPGTAANHYQATRQRVDGSPELWQQLIAEIVESDQPAIISSEYLDRADRELAPELVAELGGPVRILITLRPLATIIPSLWQQHVKCGTAAELAPWTDDLFRIGRDHVSWQSVDHLALIQLWQEVVGEDRVVILVPDPRDPDILLRGFERAAGISSGTLVTPDRANRSMTGPESDLALALNRRAADLGITAKQQIQWVRRGVYARIIEERQPLPDEAKLALPESVRGEVERRQRDVVDLLRSSRSQVIGDPELLWRGTGPDSPAAPESELIPVDLAAGMLAALLGRSLDREEEQQRKIDRLRGKVQKLKEKQPATSKRARRFLRLER